MGLQNFKDDLVVIISNLMKYNVLNLKLSLASMFLFAPFFLHFFQRGALSNSNTICAASILLSLKSMKFTTPLLILIWIKIKLMKNSCLEAHFLYNEIHMCLSRAQCSLWMAVNRTRPLLSRRFHSSRWDRCIICWVVISIWGKPSVRGSGETKGLLFC